MEVEKVATRKKFDFIYNTTLICQWDCIFCCVDAVQVKKHGNNMLMRHSNLELEERFTIDRTKKNIYEQAYSIRVDRGQELSLDKKKNIVRNIASHDARIDISGGDSLLIEDNLNFLVYASGSLGSKNVSLTVTGSGSANLRAAEIAPYIDEYNFTFDSASLTDVANRPKGYAAGNLKRAMNFIQAGCKTRAEVPLTVDLLDKDHLVRLYRTLHDSGVDQVLLMRLFPVGRGQIKEDQIPTNDQYRVAIEVLLREEVKLKTPKIKLQCAIKHLYPYPLGRDTNPCDLYSKSFGIMPDGKLIFSPWAYNKHSNPLSEDWVLGNISTSTLDEILNNDFHNQVVSRLDENFGHCKIFAYIHSKKTDFYDRLFDVADPLYLK